MALSVAEVVDLWKTKEEYSDLIAPFPGFTENKKAFVLALTQTDFRVKERELPQNHVNYYHFQVGDVHIFVSTWCPYVALHVEGEGQPAFMEALKTLCDQFHYSILDEEAGNELVQSAGPMPPLVDEEDLRVKDVLCGGGFLLNNF